MEAVSTPSPSSGEERGETEDRGERVETEPQPEALQTGPDQSGAPPELPAMQQQIHQFFCICDTENKGYITRTDMQRLSGELPLTAMELQDVFDTLDSDGNGFLTLQEFSSGFSKVLFGQSIMVGAELYQSQWEERLAGYEDEEDRYFTLLMENLGANSVFQDPGEVRSLWSQLRHEEPHLLSAFEEFLARVTWQIKEANQEKREMESALKRKTATHDTEIKRLYEEMERQISSEQDRIQLQDSEKFQSRSHDMEKQLSQKEQELQQLYKKQSTLEEQCQELQSKQTESRVQNVKLKQTNEGLQSELRHTHQELCLTQEQLRVLQEQSSSLRREREMELYRVTEGMQRERETLLKQLELLRETNKQLQDERDVCYLNSLKKQSRKQRPDLSALKSGEMMLSAGEEGGDETLPSILGQSEDINGQDLPEGEEGGAERTGQGQRPLQPISSMEEDPRPQSLQPGCEEEEEEHTDLEMSCDNPTWDTAIQEVTNHSLPVSHSVAPPTHMATPPSPRGQPVGKETVEHEWVSRALDRLFKIVLVGNSGVGKTCLLRRFCDDRFHPGTPATVGVDYSVKTVPVGDSQVALQLWDTAGQERYRSITKQFFRKADGVVVMYDITAEQSFTAVRHWMCSVREGAGEDIPIMLLGNKTDIADERVVETREGERLAKECDFIFYECSAFSGHNVTESLLHLAMTLKEQEDRVKDRTLQLGSDSPNKKPCCSRQ
ncbi:hypothetical protein GJAV_G00270240 [Gymnothorax javanicus]|nr:hypothetical protein GJAV_G00270240 [Gymnothorax javanicus]